MKVSPKDTPKVIGLVLAIGICLALIAKTMLSQQKPAVVQAPAQPNMVAGDPQKTADLEPQQATLQQYREQIEAWSRPPQAPAGNADPFREVLPRDIVRSISQQRANTPPPRDISGNLGVDPTMNGLPGAARIDFPTITVEGVIVDTSGPSPTNYATLAINDQMIYAKEGDLIGNDMVVEKISQLGVTIRAAKEHCFIEISKSYKPNGMAPPEPPKPAVSGRHHARR